MNEMQAAIDAVMTPAIQLWVNWMFIVFLAALAFVYKHRSARIIIIAFILTLPVALIIFRLFQSVWLLGLSHILVWGPLAVYLVKTEKPFRKSMLKTPWGIYLTLLLLTIMISLVFDVRDTTMVLLGLK